MHQYKGRLILHCGSMFSGKTSALFREVNRFSIAGYKVLATKPSFDKRYSKKDILTHDKLGLTAETFSSMDELLSLVEKNKPDVLAVDEIQFLNDQRDDFIDLINEFLKRGLTIVLAGLDMDYLGTPFDVTERVFAISDYVTKHHAVCSKCGSDAWVSHRTVDNADRLVLGSSDIYEPLCRTCFNKEKEKQAANKNQLKFD